MARGPRIQFSGACYHLINRGNYRRDIFAHPKTAAAFEHCLFEMCEKMDWRLHAYVVMRNHFHLAAETTRPNLIQGMQWLESTFAKRFNRFRQEHGHLFQGRYKALLVEPGPSLLRVVNYIHLNPVRAKIVPTGQLAQFHPSSFPRFQQRDRPARLICERWLGELGLQDTPSDWRRYLEILNQLTLDPRQQEERKILSRGWLIGRPEWGHAIIQQHQQTADQPLPYGDEWASLHHAQWAKALAQLLLASGRTLAQAASDRRGAAWKIALAHALRHSTSATIPWIARTLHLGSPRSLSVYLSKFPKI